MKQIIIFLLIVIVAFLGYDFYKDWQRFHPPVSQYQVSQNIDLNYHDPTVVMDYHRAVKELDAFVMQQWTVYDIDVRNPEDDDSKTNLALTQYADLQSKVSYYEAILENSTKLKSQGRTNDEIYRLEHELTSEDDLQAEHKKTLLWQLFHQEMDQMNRLGVSSTLVYELQKLLIDKGYEIPLDGVYAQATKVALMEYEIKNKLYPDGELDVLVFESLLE